MDAPRLAVAQRRSGNPGQSRQYPPCASLGACAVGSNSAYTQAPIFFSESDGLAVDAAGRLAETLAEAGDFTRGAPGFSSVAGKAILPVNAPAGVQPVLANTATVVAGLLGETGLSASVSPAPAATVGLTAPAGLATVNLGATPAGATANVVALSPVLSPVAATVAMPALISSVGSALPTQGLSLAAVTAHAIPAVSGPLTTTVGGPLSGVATQQQKARACGLKLQC